MTGKTSAQLKAEANRFFDLAAQLGGSDGSACRARGTELLAAAAEVEKVEAAPKPAPVSMYPASRSRTGTLTKVQAPSAGDIVKRAKLRETYRPDFDDLPRQVPALRPYIDEIIRILEGR